jgi:2-polyprenyl-6-methoxyphenol hydroxylase-like FAD-dependent oxidoreductase
LNRTALIVGAGIGGLSAALALRSAGWAVRVFEQAESPRELGFALGGPMLVALRPALHGALLDAVGAETITLGARVDGFSANDSAVTLSVSGSTVQGDLLVGADGTRSVIRQQLHPDQLPPRHSGIVAVRGAVHGALRHLGDLHAVYYLGPGVESMFVRASDTGIYWFLSMAKSVAPFGVEDPAAVIRSMAPKFDDTFRAITSATDDIRYDELVDRDPLPWWGSGVVTLLGDAAHPLLPHTGQGAAQAIVDAVTLGKAVRNSTNLEASLRAYERERIPRTAAFDDRVRSRLDADQQAGRDRYQVPVTASRRVMRGFHRPPKGGRHTRVVLVQSIE